MARVCAITGKKTSSGSNVSHSNAHTKRVFKANLQEKTFQSDLLGRSIRLRVSTRAIRTLDKYNGLDGFMLTVKNRRVVEDFNLQAKRIRKEIIAAAVAQGKMPERVVRPRRVAKAK